MNFLPYDWVAIGYLAFTGILVLIFRKMLHAGISICWHACSVLLALYR